MGGIFSSFRAVFKPNSDRHCRSTRGSLRRSSSCQPKPPTRANFTGKKKKKTKEADNPPKKIAKKMNDDGPEDTSRLAMNPKKKMTFNNPDGLSLLTIEE